MASTQGPGSPHPRHDDPSSTRARLTPAHLLFMAAVDAPAAMDPHASAVYLEIARLMLEHNIPHLGGS